MRPLRAAITVLIGMALLSLWFAIASDYDYGALAGTYSFHGGGVTSKLVLRKDHSFHQEITQFSQTKAADGEWHRIGEGGVSFSPQFLRLPGAKTFTEDFGQGDGGVEDREFFAEFDKNLTVYPTIRFNRDRQGPIYYRRLF